MMIAAGQAAVLIENVRLFREVERLTLETDTMRTISEAAATQTDVSKILEVAMVGSPDCLGYRWLPLGSWIRRLVI